MRVRRAAICVLGVVSLLLVAEAGVAYRFFDSWDVDEIPPSAWAPRWNESDFPLKFRLLENDQLPRGWSERFLRSVVEEGFDTWNSVSTTTVRVELEEEPLLADRTEADGIHEIGFSSHLEGYGRVATTEIYASRAGVFYECDIPLRPEGWGAHRASVRSWLKYVVIHELGHCLGLHHSEEYPISDWAPDVPSTFFPPPAMAYAWASTPELAEDDRIGVSLLYPTRRFTRSVGSVGGRVSVDGEPARFVYVQSFRAQTIPEAGPGTFTDGNGEFFLEGLEPGRVLLWMHPIVGGGGSAHPKFLRLGAAAAQGRSAVQDQWRWVTVEAGETQIIPDIVAVTGRREQPP